MSVHLQTHIDIEASPERVWAVLSDLPAYGAWNPFITQASGTVALGQRLEIQIEPQGGGAQRFRPTVQAVEPGRELRWLGRLGIPGLLDGEHTFKLQPTRSGARLTHEERFRGVLVPLVAGKLRARVLPSFEAMNEALRRRVAEVTV
jgi:hypothetical protein